MRVGVYAIALNEEANVVDWAASIGKVDYLLVVDTGSTDNTRLLAKTAGARVERISLKPFRFDDAWNAALALMPADLDVVVAASLDIRFPKNWKAQLLKEWPHTDGPATLKCWFAMGDLRWRQPFVHSRHGFRYRYPVHEILSAVGPSVDVDSELTFTHPPNSRRDTSENLELLRMARAENPEESRHLHYLGRELMYQDQWEEAIVVLTQHLESGAFAEERAESLRYCGDCHKALGRSDAALVCYRRATEIDPNRREGWVAVADLCRTLDLWRDCLIAAEHALEITDKSWYFNWDWAWGPMPLDLAALACHFLGLHQEAIDYGRRACELAPDDQRLADNVRFYESGLKEMADAHVG